MNPVRAILLLAAVLFLWNAWGYDLWAPDEPYFAEGAREMIADGRWRVPHVNGQITTDKPPLFFWLVALASLPLGAVTSLSARLPSALAALGSVALSMRLARRLGCDARGAAAAGAILSTAYLFWDKARAAQIDALLCLLILVALSAFEALWSRAPGGKAVRVEQAGERPVDAAADRRAGLVFWAAAALAVLAKGPVGLLVPLGIALAALALERRLRDWGRFAPVAGPLLFAAIVGAWMIVASAGGEYSVWAALREHVFERAALGMHHRQPPWYYLGVLPVQLMPWSPLMPGAIVLAWRRRDAGDRFLLVWAAFVVLFFSIPIEKRDLYVLPAYPALALLVGRLVARVCGWEAAPARVVAALGAERPAREGRATPDVSSAWLTIPLALVGLIFLALGPLLPSAAQRLIAAEPSVEAGTAAAPGPAPFRVLGGAMAAAGIAILVASWRRRPRAALAVSAGGMALVFLAAVSAVFPALDSRRSARAFAGQVREATAAARGAGGEVVSLGLGNLTDALAFYSDGVYARRVAGPWEFAQALLGNPSARGLAHAERLYDISAAAGRRFEVISASRVGRRDVVLLAASPAQGAPAADPESPAAAASAAVPAPSAAPAPAAGAATEPPAGLDFGDAFWKHWGDGQAELAGYDLTFPRYGEKRAGVAVTIFVTETFSGALRVKADPGRHPASDEAPVMKLNLVHDFPTGIYDYSLMTSAFVALAPAAGLAAGSPLKVSFSGQEWCGHAYAQLLFDRGSARLTSHSYFDGEADEERELRVPAGALDADTVLLWARGLAAPSLRAGERRDVPLVGSLLTARLTHRPLEVGRATLARAPSPERVTVPAGAFEAERRTVEIAGGPTWTILVEAAHPRRIVQWETSDGEKAILLASGRMKYWEMKAGGMEKALARLGLKPRPRRTP